MKVSICGIPHDIVEVKDHFTTDIHMGQIDYVDCTIKINKDLPTPLKKQAACHEIIHGILTHTGYEDLSCDETFVQTMAQAIAQAFSIKTI